jgi:hypothetical protein
MIGIDVMVERTYIITFGFFLPVELWIITLIRIQKIKERRLSEEIVSSYSDSLIKCLDCSAIC